MPAPDWFKARNGKCVEHGTPLLEYMKVKNKKTGLMYCPKCRDEAQKKNLQNEREKLSE